MSVLVGFVAFVVLAAAGYALSGWLLMLVLGWMHNAAWEGFPALGFWQSVVLAVGLSILKVLFFGVGSVGKRE